MNKAERNFLAFLETMKHAREIADEKWASLSDERKEAIANKYIKKATSKIQQQ